jgi:hypothetical protein
MRPMESNTNRLASNHSTRHSLRQRHSIPEAAKVLNITEEAVRQRVKRGTLDSIKVSGKLYVLLEGDTSNDQSSTPNQPVNDIQIDLSNDTSNDTSRLVDALEDEIAYLRRQLEQANERDRENRRIIAGLVQRVPELEPAPEPRESPKRASEDTDKGKPPPDMERRSWWQRFFFGP